MKDWKFVELGNVLNYEQPTKYIVESTNYDSKFATPVLTAGQSFILGYTDETEGIFKDYPVIIFDDFTTAFKYVDFPFKVKSSAMKILKEEKGVADLRFLFYCMQTIDFIPEQHKRYWISKYSNFQIPLPPLEEQKRISAILDAADLHRQKTKALLNKYDELAQALFLDMFGDPVTNPKGWEKIKLGSILTYLTSGSRGWAKFYSDQGDVFLRIQNIGYNRLTNKDNIYIKAPKSQEANRTLVYTNDIVLSITADLGRSAVIPENFPRAFINQHLAILRINENFNPYFISAYIASNGGQTFFKKLDKGGVKAGLNFSDLKSYMVFLVPLEIQNKFSQTIKQIESQKLQAEQSIQKAEELFQGLLQKAFKGEL